MTGDATDGGVSTPEVLYLDPDPAARQRCLDHLGGEASNVTVTTVETVSDAFDRLDDGSVDCLVTEYDLPDTDGIDVVRRVRTAHPAVPVVVFTATAAPGVGGRAVEAGVAGYRRKTGRPDQYRLLARDVRRAVDGQGPSVGEDTSADSARDDESVDSARDDDTEPAVLREKARQLDAIFETLPLSLYIKDEEARHVRVSRAHVTGYGGSPGTAGKDGVSIDSPADFRGKTDLDLFPEVNAREQYEDDRRVIETGERIVDREEHHRKPDGADLWVTTTKVPWRDEDGEIRGLLGFTLDITDRKRYKRRLERQNERLDEFAGVVSHDLRNPLNVITASVALARETGDTSHLDSAVRAAERIEELIESLLGLARAGTLADDPDLVPLGAAATEAWHHARTGDAHLDVRVPDGVSVEADSQRLLQAFENLFRNAVDHNDESVSVWVGLLETGDDSPTETELRPAVTPDETGPDLERTTDETETETVTTGFYVADDGSGLPPERRDRVFDHGFTTDEDGTGFGLSIVADIALAHGWDVRAVESEHGGARFEFRTDDQRDRSVASGECSR